VWPTPRNASSRSHKKPWPTNNRDIFDKVLLTIREHPQIGHGRAEISPAHRIFPAGRDIIIYRLTERAIPVSRSLHERMDLDAPL